MFQLREDHLSEFSNVVLDTFETRGVSHLRRCLASLTGVFQDDELRVRIRGCVQRAQAYGLTGQRQVMGFVDATYLAGEFFDTLDWARDVLNDNEMSADLKSELIVSLARHRV